MIRRIKNIGMLLLALCASSAQAGVDLIDLAGRPVTLEAPATRFVISEGRYVTTLALLQPRNPFQGLVGMMSSIGYTNPALETFLFEQYPEAKNIPLFGRRDKNSVSVEKIIDLAPELAIFGVQDHGPSSRNAELIGQLQRAGIQVLFIDFRLDPLNNTVPSLELLGKALGRSEQVARYIHYYQNKFEHIRSVGEQQRHRPTVFLQAHAGRMDCCRAMASGMLGPFVEVVGGRNIADKVAEGPTSLHTEEFLLTEDPAVWIGTASGTLSEYQSGKSPVAAGPGVSSKAAHQSLQGFLKQPAFVALRATHNKRAHSLWHDLYNSPLNIIALEAFAVWIHPEAFTDLDLQRTVEEIHEQFLHFPAMGAYTASLGHRAE